MEFSKKLNLLPQSYKDRYINRYLMIGCGAAVIILVLVMGITYLSCGMAKLSIKKLTEENIEYQTKQSTIVGLEKQISKNKEVISEYEKDNFPFAYFIQTLENQKPQGLKIISIDSVDRLIAAEPKGDDKESEKTEDSAEQTEKQAEKQADDTAAESDKPQGEKKAEEPGKDAASSNVVYEKDLSGNKLSVRGYSTNMSDIASFISALSRLPYVAETEIKAIEEHSVNGTEKANIFEAILTLK
ncbi:MAG: hypothetical protein BWY15_01783 [Firmicutes bacterium ADurb.Bin193]|nr:MAG: hypothetical protein BWY15_01783 [Firmicutes bacterium ADurb.Bin193]